MLYDLNIPWTPSLPPSELQRTLSFLSELGYKTIALNHTITDPIPSQITNQIPDPLPFPIPGNLVILRRITVTISDPSLNHRLPQLAAAYDILAIRPTTEKAYLAACTSATEQSVISLDLSIRYPFPFKPKPLSTATNRGLFIEINYAQATMGDSNSKRNFISNTMGIIRATRGKGLVVSSEAKTCLGVRAPADVVNLLGVWGLASERARESVGVNPRGVVVNEGIKRKAFKNLIEVIDGGESLVSKDKGKGMENGNGNGEKDKVTVGKKQQSGGGIGKRKAEDTNTVASSGDTTPPISKRAAKKARLQALKDLKEGAAIGEKPLTLLT